MSASAQTAAAKAIAEDQPMLHTSLTAALIAALAEMPVIPKTRTADAGSYSYDYADLEGMRSIVVPILAKHGLAARTPVHAFGDGLAVTVQLLHVSGETVSDEPLPFPHGRDAQATGSAITYFRRYALGASLNLVTGDDDDGAAAQPRKTKGPRTVAPKTVAKATLLGLCGGDKAKAKEAWEGIDGDGVKWDGDPAAEVEHRWLEWVNEDPTEAES